MEVNSQLHTPVALPPGETARGILCIGGWVGPLGCLDVIEERKISCPCRESKPDSSAVHSVA
jgi:hypothetical protein